MQLGHLEKDVRNSNLIDNILDEDVMEPFMTQEANHKTLFMMAMTCEVTVMIVKCNTTGNLLIGRQNGPLVCDISLTYGCRSNVGHH